MAYGYKINGVDIDDIWEHDEGATTERTKSAFTQYYRVNGATSRPNYEFIKYDPNKAPYQPPEYHKLYKVPNESGIVVKGCMPQMRERFRYSTPGQYYFFRKFAELVVLSSDWDGNNVIANLGAIPRMIYGLAIGGGGGGGANGLTGSLNLAAGGGGSGGGAAFGLIDFCNEVVSFKVGAGGTGGKGANDGNSGEDSTITLRIVPVKPITGYENITGYGGAHGAREKVGNGSGGTSRNGYLYSRETTINLISTKFTVNSGSGGNGKSSGNGASAPGYLSNNYFANIGFPTTHSYSGGSGGGGGGGGASLMGSGGSGASQAKGGNGSGYGGGGAGGGGNLSDALDGGNGANGCIIFYW
jgi:hypothetical protein